MIPSLFPVAPHIPPHSLPPAPGAEMLRNMTGACVLRGGAGVALIVYRAVCRCNAAALATAKGVCGEGSPLLRATNRYHASAAFLVHAFLFIYLFKFLMRQ